MRLLVVLILLMTACKAVAGDAPPEAKRTMVAPPPVEEKVVLKLTENEANALAELINDAVKAQGLSRAQAGLAIFSKLQGAVQESRKKVNEK